MGRSRAITHGAVSPKHRAARGLSGCFISAILRLFRLLFFPACKTKIIKRAPRVPRRLHDRGVQSRAAKSRFYRYNWNSGKL